MQKIKSIYKGKLLNLVTKRVRLPNGYVTTLEIIRHPGAALIVPFLTNDKMIMLRQLRPVIGSYIYELPAGTLNKGESPLACARREIIEETGFSAKTFTLLGRIYPVPGYSTEKIIIYKAEDLKRCQRMAEDDEIIKNYIFNKSQIKRLFKGGRIIDAKTICGLALCGWL